MTLMKVKVYPVVMTQMTDDIPLIRESVAFGIDVQSMLIQGQLCGGEVELVWGMEFCLSESVRAFGLHALTPLGI